MQNLSKIFTAFASFGNMSGRNIEHRERISNTKCWCYTFIGIRSWQLPGRGTRNVQALLTGHQDGMGDRVFHFALDTPDQKFLQEKLNTVDSLEYAAQLKVAFGFVLENVEDGSFRYYYAHGNNTLLTRSEFVATRKTRQKSRIYQATAMSLNRSH